MAWCSMSLGWVLGAEVLQTLLELESHKGGQAPSSKLPWAGGPGPTEETVLT